MDKKAIELNDWPDKERREPCIYNPNFLVMSKLRGTIQNGIDTELRGKTHLDILDVGCGSKPYYPLFASIAKCYVGVDAVASEKVDCVAVAENLPHRGKIFDLVIATSVLEHVNNPKRTISEIYRVLKKRGVVILSAPGVYPFHGPPDFWRFTDDGLRKVFANFRSVRVLSNGGPMACLIRIINLYLNLLKLPNLVKICLFAFNNLMGLILDRLTLPYPSIHNKFLTAHYTVIAIK